MPTDPPLPRIFTRSDALAAGLTRHAVAHRLATCRWRTIGRGAFCLQQQWDAADARSRHVLHVLAESRYDEGLVISHESAAAVHGWPVPWAGYSLATFTDGRANGKNLRSAHRLVRAAPLAAPDVVAREGLRVTSPARTAADVLRHLPASESVAMVDVALRLGQTSRAAIDEVLRRQAGWTHVPRARLAREWLDPRRDSYLESSSFALLASRGILPPLSQVHVYDAAGRFVGIVDGLWLPEGVVGECDGRSKYDLDVIGRLDPVEARRQILREKAREDALRSTGLGVVRWGTYEVRHRLDDLATTVRSALARGGLTRFTGQLRWSSSPTDLVDLRRYPPSSGS
ncbi:hypothetical protein [Angustibacter sp. Root456]|uniref:hypothetical protein n=1 Tax=Angustibacter sp. Root456 TaxID=1736539 RepID=UPI0006F2D243|nr:hypothetical protein [Angustibacter sp. Root456]KQX61609.1 hypothetical protein ASD06_13415 [Angustibacter sp. Root456]